MKKILGIIMIGLGCFFVYPTFNGILKIISTPEDIVVKLGMLTAELIFVVVIVLLIRYGLKFYK